MGQCYEPHPLRQTLNQLLYWHDGATIVNPKMTRVAMLVAANEWTSYKLYSQDKGGAQAPKAPPWLRHLQ